MMSVIYKNMYKKLTSEDFITSSIIRFGSHGQYIEEKILVDVFAVKGNLKIAECLRKYIQKHLDKLRALPKIRLLDVGPAIGALTTLVALQELSKFGLMDKTQVYFVDVSQRVIDKTQGGDFLFPKSIVDPSLKASVMKKLKYSKGFVLSASEMPFKDDYFNLVLANFLFHHLHDDIKPVVAAQIQRVATKGAFIGIADEWFENYKKDYVMEHVNDEIPLAYESIISLKKLLSFFTRVSVKECSSPKNISEENYYYFYGEKN